MGQAPPITAFPAGEKDPGGDRVDFKPSKFDKQIHQHGLRVGWSKLLWCPCVSPDPTSDQSDPDCEFCGGSGHLYVRPAGSAYQVPTQDVGPITAHQRAVLDRAHASIVPAIVQGVEQTVESVDVIGPWNWGSIAVTMVAGNRLHHQDRICLLDSLIAYSELRAIRSSTADVRLRYPASPDDPDLLLVDDEGRRYVHEEHFDVTAEGDLRWITGQGPTIPEIGYRRLSIRYTTIPHYVCWRATHLTRTSMAKLKIPDAAAFPHGKPIQLPQQWSCMLEYVPDRVIVEEV